MPSLFVLAETLAFEWGAFEQLGIALEREEGASARAGILAQLGRRALAAAATAAFVL